MIPITGKKYSAKYKIALIKSNMKSTYALINIKLY